MADIGSLGTPRFDEHHGEVLIGIMTWIPDFRILQEQLWYRIPVKSWESHHLREPEWLAIYHTSAFGADAHKVQYYGRVERTERGLRRDFFPAELPNPKSDREYYRIFLHSLERLPAPIVSNPHRRNPFISTTWRKFSEAGQINDLFDESPLEDFLWAELKARGIPAERQWEVKPADKRYYLDFAIGCNAGKIDVEADGVTWHKGRRSQDSERDKALEKAGWDVRRFRTREIQEAAGSYCIAEVEAHIATLGGLDERPLAPQVSYELPADPAQPLAVFEDGPDYDLD